MSAKAIVKKKGDETLDQLCNDALQMANNKENINAKKVSDLVDRVIKKYQEKENEQGVKIQKASEHIMLAYVISEKCIVIKNRLVNNYLRKDCMDKIMTYL